MKILCKGDQHLRDKRPKKRKDDFYMAQMGKHKFIMDYVQDNMIDIVIQPGDFFDSPKTPISLILDYARLRLKTFDYSYAPEVAVFGQHDLFFHSFKGVENTPLNLMQELGIVQKTPYVKDDVHIYGASWGEEIPEIEDKDKFNILVTHRMVIDDKMVWEGQEHFDRAQHLLREHKFDLIVSGDNHQTFTSIYRSRHLVNAGSIMRTSTAQVEHEPCFFVFDTEELTLEKVVIPYEKDVFILDSVEKEKDVNREVEVFIETLSEKSYRDFSFRRNLVEAMSQSPEDVQKILQMIIERSGLDEQFKSERKSAEAVKGAEGSRGKKEKTGVGARKLRKKIKRRIQG